MEKLSLWCNDCGRFLVLICGCLMMMMINVPARAALDERGENERQLVYDLFDKNGYNPLIRPVVNNNDSLSIRFNLALSQIINVDEVNQVMKTNVWLQIYWTDYQLGWDPAKYGNIDSIRIKPEKVWVPDFVLFNNADGNYEVTYKSNCVLYYTAEVNWIPPAIYKSSCSIDVMYFPFDQQICEMKFGSWTHKGTALKYSFYLNMTKLDLTDYLKSGSWDIIDCPGKIVPIRDNVTGEEKEQIVFEFVLRRKTLFYTINLIIPCVLISFVSICVFALPADAGEKITLCISVLLALVVFLLLVSKILPPSLTIPLIAKYLLFTFVMNLVAILATIIIINRNYRTPRTHTMPHWVRVIFLRVLPKFLFMTRPDQNKRWQSVSITPPPSFHSTPDSRRANISSDHDSDLVELREVHHPHCKLNVQEHNHKNSGTGHRDSKLQQNLQDSPSSRRTTGDRDSKLQQHLQDSPSSRRTTGDRDSKLQQHLQDSPSSRRKTATTATSTESTQLKMTPELQKTLEAVNFIYHHLKSEVEYETVLEDWKFVARVIDRLLLIVFLSVTTAGTAGILLNAPYILEYVDQDRIIQQLLDYIRKAKVSSGQQI